MGEPGGTPPAAGGVPYIAGFYFSFRIMTVLLAVRGFGADPRTGSGINIAAAGTLLLATAFCAAGSAGRRFRDMARLASVRWALLFLAFSGCSLVWSRTVSLPDSAAYWCAMAADVVIATLLLRAGPLDSAANALMQGFVWGACAVAAIAWLLPAEPDLRLGDDAFLGPNQIGYVCAFGFFFAQYLMREAKAKLAGPAALLALTTLRSLSKTTIIAFVAGQGYLLLRDPSWSRRSKLLALAGVAVVLALFWGLLTAYYTIYSTAGYQMQTLTGRLGIWAYFLAESLQRPWLGHGFDSAWKVIPPFGPDQFMAAHAHNELLQQFYAYGLAGVALFTGLYGSLCRQVRRLRPGPNRAFFAAFLLFVLVRGLADTQRFDLSLPLWSVIMVSLLMDGHLRAPEPRRTAPAGHSRQGLTRMDHLRAAGGACKKTQPQPAAGI